MYSRYLISSQKNTEKDSLDFIKENNIVSYRAHVRIYKNHFSHESNRESNTILCHEEIFFIVFIV